jgi:hypothetical protein
VDVAVNAPLFYMPSVLPLSHIASETDCRPPCWKAAGHLIVEALGEDAWAVFHGEFWDSTVLGVIDHALLIRLLNHAGPMEQDILIKDIAVELDVPEEEAFRRYCGEALRQMSFVGLVRRVAQP